MARSTERTERSVSSAIDSRDGQQRSCSLARKASRRSTSFAVGPRSRRSQAARSCRSKQLFILTKALVGLPVEVRQFEAAAKALLHLTIDGHRSPIVACSPIHTETDVELELVLAPELEL